MTHTINPPAMNREYIQCLLQDNKKRIREQYSSMQELSHTLSCELYTANTLYKGSFPLKCILAAFFVVAMERLYMVIMPDDRPAMNFSFDKPAIISHTKPFQRASAIINNLQAPSFEKRVKPELKCLVVQHWSLPSPYSPPPHPKL